MGHPWPMELIRTLPGTTQAHAPYVLPQSIQMLLLPGCSSNLHTRSPSSAHPGLILAPVVQRSAHAQAHQQPRWPGPALQGRLVLFLLTPARARC